MKDKEPVTTVSDILTNDSVNGVLNSVIKRKDKIKSLIVIAEVEGDIEWQSSEMDTPMFVYLLEVAKIGSIQLDIKGD